MAHANATARDFDLDASELAEKFQSPEGRVIDEQIAHRRELLKELFTVFGIGYSLTNTEKLDVLHELTRPEDRENPRDAATRLTALAKSWFPEGGRHNRTRAPIPFFLRAADLYAGLADRIEGIKSGAIRDEPAAVPQ